MAVQVLGRRMHDDVGASARAAASAPAWRPWSRPRARAPAACAIAAVAAMSVTVQSGLAGVSIQTSRVLPGRTAARTAAGSVMSMSSTTQSPARSRSSAASCAATSTSPSAPARGRPARAPGTPPSPPPCRRRTAARLRPCSRRAITASAWSKVGLSARRVDAAGAVLVVGVAQVGRRDVDRRRDGARLLVDPAERLRGDAVGAERGSVVHRSRPSCDVRSGPL